MKHPHFKRIISLFIAIAMLLTMIPAFAATSGQFVDFPTGWSKAAMTFSVDSGLINGKTADRIDPQANITRAEIATIINRAFGAKITCDISSYSDIKTSDWFYTEMQKAVNMQTFQGDGSGKLHPNDYITREEVMTVIARAIVLENDDYVSINKFKDYGSISDWAKPYVSALISGGYVSGYEDGTVKPKANITREEFAQLMYNIFKTYLSSANTTYTSVGNQNCVMINNEGITLNNVVINGDLVLGDGVGTSNINLNNVTIKGRLVARGGVITLKNVTVDGGVVVKNVNGTTHFNNYGTDIVFNGAIEHTYTTYLSPSFSIGNRRPSGSTTVDRMVEVTFVYDNGDANTIQNVLDGNTATKPTDPTKTGYQFKYWTLDGTTEYNFATPVTEPITLTALWTKVHTVTFVYGNGDADTIQSVLDGGYATRPVTDPVWAGHNFEFWTADGVNAFDFDNTAITSDITISAKWTGIHIVTFVYDNGDANTTQNVLDGNTATKPTDPTKTGYQFKYWTVDGTTEYNFATPVTGPITLTALWTKVHTVTFVYGNGDANTTQNVLDGGYATRPVTDPVWAGHNFEFWTVDGSTEFDFNTAITSDITISAKWKTSVTPPTTHIVTFVYDNGNANTTQNVLNGNTATKPANPTKAGYQFKYWTLDGTTEYNFATPVTGPITLTALWQWIDPTVIRTVKFYAFPESTQREEFVGELEIVSGTSFGTETDGTISDIVKTIYREVQNTESPENRYELWDFANPTGARNFVSKGYYDAAEDYLHYIRPDLVYKDTNGKWITFTGDTVVTSDMKVYAVKKQIELYLEGSILGLNLPSVGATLKTPYNSATRAVDSLKDALYLSRNSFDIVFTDSFMNNLFAKIAPKSKGLIDENGYLQNFEYSMKIADVISETELKKEIEKYIKTTLKTGTDADINKLLSMVSIDEMVDYIGIVKLAELVGYDTIRNKIMEDGNRDVLVGYIQDELASEDNTFRNQLLGNNEFLQQALANEAIKNAVIGTLIADPSILIDALSIETNKTAFINIAVEKPEFINALLANPNFKSKIIDLVHSADVKTKFIALVTNDTDFSGDLFDKAWDNPNVKSYVKNFVKTNNSFLKKIVNEVSTEDYKFILNSIATNAKSELKQKIEDIVGTSITDDAFNDIIANYVYSTDTDTYNGKITNELRTIITGYDPDDNTGINGAITEYLLNEIDGFTDDEIKNKVKEDNSVIVTFVTEYLNEDFTDSNVVTAIDDIVLEYVNTYINYTDEQWTSEPGELKDFVEKLKSDFIDEVKSTTIDDNLKSIIRGFITDDANETVVRQLFGSYYSNLTSYIIDNINVPNVNSEIHKIVKNQARLDSTKDMLTSFIVSNDSYIRNNLLTDAELKKYIERYKDDETFKSYVTANVTNDTIIDYIMELRTTDAQKLDQFIAQALDVLESNPGYTSLIECFRNKKDTYLITKDNVAFAKAVADAVDSYTFEKALELLGAGPVYDLINKIGADQFVDIYDDARSEFTDSIRAVDARIALDSEYSESVNMSMRLKINYAELVDTYFTKLYAKVINKVNNVAPYYYSQNSYLREFVEGIKTEKLLTYNAAAKTDVNSGYKFKSFMEYYDMMYNDLLLIDKAVLWYGPNTPEDLVNLRDDIANDIIRAFNKLQTILEGLDEDGTIFGSYTIRDVIAKVESLQSIGQDVPALKTVIDNICKILSKVENGEVIAGGYTLDELARLSDRLESAVDALGNEEYDRLNQELEDIINKTIDKSNEIIKELDTNGTILGKVSLDELMAKVDAINNIYKKYEDKIDAAISKLADIELGYVDGKINTEYWEDVLFGKDDYNRLDLDDIFNVVSPHLDRFRVDNPYTDSNKRLVVDEFKVSGGGATATFDRYMN